MNGITTLLASRKRRKSVTTIVLHATDGASAVSSIRWLAHTGNSYHYIIADTGKVYKCVPTGREAFHAGKSFGPEGDQVNQYSIGISFDNFESRKEAITGEQMDAAEKLIGELKKAIPTIKWITTHKAVAPGRKTDPAMLSKSWIYRQAEKYRLVVWGITP
jgi:N-acetylmuramoyl-L-alanine amidase